VQHRYGFPLPARIRLSSLRMVCCRRSESVGRHWDTSCVDRCREKGSMQDVHVSVVDVVLASGDEFIGAESPQSWSLSMVEIRLACSLASAHPLTVNSQSREPHHQPFCTFADKLVSERLATRSHQSMFVAWQTCRTHIPGRTQSISIRCKTSTPQLYRYRLYTRLGSRIG